MAELATIKETVKRATSEGIEITEHALRMWIRNGSIPVRKAGTTALVYYPNLMHFLTCADGECDNKPVQSYPDVFMKIKKS